MAAGTAELRARLLEYRGRRESVAFVPTMGALHEGHLALVRRARSLGDRVVASVFVNPRQFGPREDFARYPRNIARDEELAASAGVDLLWAPEGSDVYPPHFRTLLEPEGLADVFEGAIRPGHFRGVATVVARLLAIVRPDVMLLGQKDAQQCVVLEALVRDLELPVRVVRHPTLREPDGLAMSSRNVYLSPDERHAASTIPAALRAAREAAAAGAGPERARAAARASLAGSPALELQYAAVVDGGTFASVTEAASGALLVVAVRLGRTRLIDNAWLYAPEPELDALP